MNVQKVRISALGDGLKPPGWYPPSGPIEALSRAYLLIRAPDQKITTQNDLPQIVLQ